MKNFTYLFRLLFVFAFLHLYTIKGFSQQIEKHLTLPTSEKIGFLEYKPAGYATEGNVKHPVIIFLHGIGERGNGTTDLRYVARIGLPRMIKLGHNMTFTWNGKKETFLVLSPQCPLKYSMWPELIVNEMIRYAKEQLRSDTNRIYITGLSMGGGGTYRFISRQQKQAESVAAAATICAPCTFTGDPNNVSRAKLPLWSFHAANDSIALAMCTESAIRKINETNPQVKPLKTIWPDGGHNVWDRVYTDTNYRYNGVVNIYEWFLGQSKTLQPNKLPVAKAGSDVRITVKEAAVKLNASSSYDPDGKIVRYVWKKISGPAAGYITQKMGPLSYTTATGLTKTGVYLFELAVVDNRATYTKDTLKVTVDSAAVVTVPTPVPSPDTVVTTVPKDTVVTTVPKDTVVTTVPKDTVVTTVPKDTVVTTVPKDTVVTTVPKDTVVTTVPKPTTKPNLPPVARTTQDRSIPVEWNYFPVVSGWPSTDADGYIARFKWEKVSGPDSFNIVSPNTCATRINKLVRGTYVFRVTAYDNKGASSYDDVVITMTTLEDRKKAAAEAAAAAAATTTATTTTTSTVTNNAVVEAGQVSAAVPLTVIDMPASFRAYPNPATSLVHLEYQSEDRGRSLISIHNAAGKLIKTIVFDKSVNFYRHNLDISRLPEGLYHINISTGNKTGMQTKIVKQ